MTNGLKKLEKTKKYLGVCKAKGQVDTLKCRLLIFIQCEDFFIFSWAETGTGIFAFLNIIVASITLLICLSILVLYINESINHTDVIDAFMWCMCLGTNLGVLIVFVFAALLFLGVYQKRTSFLLAYVIFGVIVDVTLVSAVVASHYVSIDVNLKKTLRKAVGDIYGPVTHAIIGICVVHTLLLIMICRAWFLIKSRRSEDCKKLVNHCDEVDWRTV